MKSILVTGAAGFIGSNLVLELLKTKSDICIVGLDNLNDYYDVSIKEYRLSKIEREAAFHSDCSWKFIKGNIADRTLIDSLFEEYRFSIVVNLAAQAGVRYSITNPDVYIESNLIGFYNIILLNIWSMLHPLLFMDLTRKCLIRQMIRLIILYHCMLQLRKAMSFWLMLIQSSTIFLQPA